MATRRQIFALLPGVAAAAFGRVAPGGASSCAAERKALPPSTVDAAPLFSDEEEEVSFREYETVVLRNLAATMGISFEEAAKGFRPFESLAAAPRATPSGRRGAV